MDAVLIGGVADGVTRAEMRKRLDAISPNGPKPSDNVLSARISALRSLGRIPPFVGSAKNPKIVAKSHNRKEEIIGRQMASAEAVRVARILCRINPRKHWRRLAIAKRMVAHDWSRPETWRLKEGISQ